jgi:hypothetical protein
VSTVTRSLLLPREQAAQSSAGRGEILVWDKARKRVRGLLRITMTTIKQFPTACAVGCVLTPLRGSSEVTIPYESSPESSQIECDGAHFAAMGFVLLFP